ncbi:hypothetical protein A5821_001732 [Enterococcus sp. 7F3_DIV0205]|uniref:Uncharacterized protein n=1 Tax=Candidatus Enterococcus palustris TaxID=1834189 RepID=A0AAQ3W9B3_9ENTE|nr:hypothetical protein A5821_002074 [Enterococcus sp. 7F3_DIV0205]
MYLLLVALGIIVSIHSILFLFIVQKNTELTNKIKQLEKNFSPLKSNIQRQILQKKETRKSEQTLKRRKIKPMKRGSR